jgi:hypothetical protein
LEVWFDMAKALLAKGAHGELVRRAQLRLRAHGFDPMGADGSYGGNTRAAVIAFQGANGLDPSGVIDSATWTALIGGSPPDLRERALQLTAAFEGHGFMLVQGNFDGAGLTWGIIGFTLKHGEIGKIVSAINAARPDLLHQAFGDGVDELLSIVAKPVEEQIAWADGISSGARKTVLAEPWKTAFAVFGSLPEVQALQLHEADADYFQPAKQTAQRYNLTTELGVALAFDIHVQNGGIKKSAATQVADLVSRQPPAEERDLRVIIANAVADSTGRYREDVRARKLAIAVGAGSVHGEAFTLANWGLDDSPASI